jgi:hypothetical protein
MKLIPSQETTDFVARTTVAFSERMVTKKKLVTIYSSDTDSEYQIEVPEMGYIAHIKAYIQELIESSVISPEGDSKLFFRINIRD